MMIVYVLVAAIVLFVAVGVVLAIHDGDKQRAVAQARRNHYNSRKI